MATGLAKNGMYTLLSNIALAASNWLVLMLITKHYNTDQLGMFVLALSLFSPAFLLASFKVRTLLIVDKDWQFSVEDYACSRLLANSVCVILILLIAKLFYPTIPVEVLLLVGLYKFADAISEFAQSYLRRYEHFRLIAISTCLRAIVTILALVIAIAADVFLLELLAIWAGASCLFAIFDSHWMIARWNEPARDIFQLGRVFSIRALKNAFSIYRTYFTVACALLIGALFVHAPNYALASFQSTADAGIFAAISYFLVAGGIVINSLSQAATPQLVAAYASNDVIGFKRLVLKLCGLGFLLGGLGIAGAWILGEWVLSLFYNDVISASWRVLVWVMVAAGIRYIFIFLGTALASLQRFNIQTTIALCGFVALVVSLIVLVPLYGLYGAAYSMIVAAITECIFYLLIFTRQVKQGFGSSSVRSDTN